MISEKRMWQILPLLMLVFLCWVERVGAATASLTAAWDRSPDPTVTGAKIYYGTNHGLYYASKDVGDVVTATVDNLIPGVTYYLVVVAYNSARVESSYSNEISAMAMGAVGPGFWYDFGFPNYVLDQCDAAGSSASTYWWVKSGGCLILNNGIGTTMTGSAPSGNQWRTYYAAEDPLRTDTGTHPQNVFSMFIRTNFLNVSHEIYVKKLADNLANSANRLAYNGILLYLRYQNDANFYYAGVRADGYATIKKRVNNVNYTLAYQRVFSGTFSTSSSTTLIPSGVWLGLRAAILNDASGKPRITLYLDNGRTGNWSLVADATDDPAQYGTIISSQGMIGVETDFIDASFDDFRLSDPATLPQTAPITVSLPYVYNFATNGVVNQTSSSLASTSPFWWVPSGGKLVLSGGVGSTITGTVPSSDPWYAYYAANKPVQTDVGAHPQNVFTMFFRQPFSTVSQEIYVKKVADNLGNTVNRAAYNGVSLYLRYIDDRNLYYAGIRADGYAIIKKQVNGVYQTLSYQKVFPGIFDPASKPTLIPTGVWIGVKAACATNSAGVPRISLYIDNGKTGTWSLVAEAFDDPIKYGPIVNGAGLVGVRTDFTDIQFDDFRVASVGQVSSLQLASVSKSVLAPGEIALTVPPEDLANAVKVPGTDTNRPTPPTALRVIPPSNLRALQPQK